MRHYKREYGRYTILYKVFFPKLADKSFPLEVVKLKNGIKMELDTTEYLQALLYVFGDFEISTELALRKIVKQDDVVIDIGANVGYLSLILSKLTGPAGKVFAFEPEPNNFKAFIKNIDLNGFTNIIPSQSAISDIKGVLKLFLASGNNRGMHSTIFDEKTLSADFVETPSLPLDDFVQENDLKKLDLVKIDVEGAELQVLKGMNKTLNTLRPKIIIELNDDAQKANNYSNTQLIKYISETFNYKCYKISEDGALIDEITNADNLNENAVCIPL
ncbi:MAG: FkbM family methyltransferase [Chloroflexota bacterium]